MSELTLMILRVGFLLLLWVFIFAIVYALRSDLFGAPARRMRQNGSDDAKPMVSAVAQPAAAPTVQPPVLPQASGIPSAGSTGPAKRLVITSGVATGTEIPLDEDFVTIGRSSDSTLVIVDEYTSTYHAKLDRRGDGWILTDLDSTNGTRLNGTKVGGPVTLPPFTPVTIGTTTFELRP